MPNQTITAALIVIGDEILSGRTKDQNIGTVAEFCAEMGIELSEVRVISDERSKIVTAVNELRSTYAYVFTTGGIGPTHDDITAEAVAEAFGVALPIHAEARRILEEQYQSTDVSPERLRMARIPEGAALIANPLSGAPGFILENVHVMAGVPRIMQAMLNSLATVLAHGETMDSRSVNCGVGESTVAAGLGAIQDAYPDLKIGSYPMMGQAPIYTQLVLRGRDKTRLDAAAGEVSALVERLHAEKGVVLPKETKI